MNNNNPFTTKARVSRLFLWPVVVIVHLAFLAPLLILSELLQKFGEFLDDAGSQLWRILDGLRNEWAILARPGLWDQAQAAFREAQVLRRHYEEQNPEYAEKPQPEARA